MERIVLGRGKANEVESQGEGQSKGGDDDPPAQKSLTTDFCLGACQSPFGKRQGFPIINVTHESDKAKNDNQDAYNAQAWDEIGHFSSLKSDMELALLYQPPPCLFSNCA